MVGICAYGAYVPVYRLSLGEIARATGGFSPPGEKAVANFDEDAITIATEAAMNCLKSNGGINHSDIEGLYFATTTSPFKEKQAAVTISTALDMKREIVTQDLLGSLRAGTSALRSALDTVKVGSANKIMVAASDCRLAYPESPLEQIVGDGGAAFLIGSTDMAVEIEGSFSLADEITDLWRRDGDRFVRGWEERFNVTEGFMRVVKESIGKAVSKFGVELSDLDRVIYYAPDARPHANLAKTLGLNYKTQVQGPLFDSVGNMGAASALFQLAAALDEARPGDRMLMASYGNGSDVFLLKVTDAIENLRDGLMVNRLITSKKMLPNYHNYLNLRGLVQTEPGRQPPINPPATTIWREQEGLLRFHGSKCKNCGNVQYPIQRICSKCESKDEFDEIRLSDQKARVYLSTIDTLGYGAESSPMWAVSDMAVGVRLRLQITDCDSLEDVPTETELEPTFRKFQRQGDIPVYFWKLRLPR